MTEPYHITSEKDIPVPENSEQILECLNRFREKFVNLNTLQDQQPESVNTTRNILRNACKKIQFAMSIRQIPNTDNKELKECIECLLQIPWTLNTSTLISYWCEMLFVQYPFTLNKNHILNLYAKSKSTSEE